MKNDNRLARKHFVISKLPQNLDFRCFSILLKMVTQAYRKKPPWLVGGKSSTADSISSWVIVLIPSKVSVFRHIKVQWLHPYISQKPGRVDSATSLVSLLLHLGQAGMMAISISPSFARFQRFSFSSPQSLSMAPPSQPSRIAARGA